MDDADFCRTNNSARVLAFSGFSGEISNDVESRMMHFEEVNKSFNIFKSLDIAR